MDTAKTLKTGLIVATVLALLVSLYHYTRLPARVAMHFGPGGKADAWASKEANLAMFVGLYVLFGLLFLGVPALMRKVPKRLVNLPNKDYWSKPENYPTAIDKMAAWSYAYGIALVLFFLLVSHLTYEANMQARPLNEAVFLVGLVAFLVYTTVATIYLFVMFRKPKEAAT